MIIKNGTSINYLLDYKNGKIKQGLSIGCELDKFLRFKFGEMCVVLGHDNVGKSYFFTWYFLCLALSNDLKFCLWSGENQKGQIMRDLIQMYSGIPFRQLSEHEIHCHYAFLEQFFTFVNNEKMYKPEDLIKIFEDSDADGCLIDPFTGLDRDMSWEANYRFLNDCRLFCNSTKKALYINTHPISQAGRSGAVYTEGDWKGHLKMPMKSEVESGKAFVNRTDNFFTVHRLTSHPTMRFYTMVSVEKIKDVETGGKITNHEEPLLFDFNRGLGFLISGKDPLQTYRPKRKTTNQIF